MNQLILIGGGLAAGGVMGYLYFRGLWWTLEHMQAQRHPYALLILSFFVRSVLVAAGFYLLLKIRWEMVALGVVGFMAIRYVLVRIWGMMPVGLRESREGEHGI